MTIQTETIEAAGFMFDFSGFYEREDGKFRLTFQESGVFAGAWELRDSKYLLGYPRTIDQLAATIKNNSR